MSASNRSAPCFKSRTQQIKYNTVQYYHYPPPQEKKNFVPYCFVMPEHKQEKINYITK